ncbi:MAG: FixH family protein [Thermodesulfovibrionales bacterium]|nr:FixH family protein [Thermodesulfovibrionales bacterium]
MRILIIIVAIIGFGAVIGSIVVGQRVFEGKVVDKPYETGLMWDKMQREKAELRVDIKNTEFKTGNNEIVFSISDKEGKPLSASSVKLTVSRPTTTAHDMEYKAFRQLDGYYHAAVKLNLYGYWDLKINIVRDGRSIMLEKRIFAEEAIR